VLWLNNWADNHQPIFLHRDCAMFFDSFLHPLLNILI
jgi:hypothetical protein